MLCVDWSCGKTGCKINNKIKNSFHYKLCKECASKRKVNICKTCSFGLKTFSGRYFCKKDNTYGLLEEKSGLE